MEDVWSTIHNTERSSLPDTEMSVAPERSIVVEGILTCSQITFTFITTIITVLLLYELYETLKKPGQPLWHCMLSTCLVTARGQTGLRHCLPPTH